MTNGRGGAGAACSQRQGLRGFCAFISGASGLAGHSRLESWKWQCARTRQGIKESRAIRKDRGHLRLRG